MVVFWVSYLDGVQRVLLFTQDERVAKAVRKVRRTFSSQLLHLVLVSSVLVIMCSCCGGYLCEYVLSVCKDMFHIICSVFGKLLSSFILQLIWFILLAVKPALVTK